MAMSRKDFVASAATLRTNQHLFIDRAAFVQFVCVTSNDYRKANPRFSFDTFMAAVGVRPDEWTERGGMGGHYVTPSAPIRVVPSSVPSRSHRKAVSA